MKYLTPDWVNTQNKCGLFSILCLTGESLLFKDADPVRGEVEYSIDDDEVSISSVNIETVEPGNGMAPCGSFCI